MKSVVEHRTVDKRAHAKPPRIWLHISKEDLGAQSYARLAGRSPMLPAHLAVVHFAPPAHPVVIPLARATVYRLALVVLQLIPVHALEAAGAIGFLALLALVNQALRAVAVIVPVPVVTQHYILHALVALQMESRVALEAGDSVQLAACLRVGITQARYASCAHFSRQQCSLGHPPCARASERINQNPPHQA